MLDGLRFPRVTLVGFGMGSLYGALYFSHRFGHRDVVVDFFPFRWQWDPEMRLVVILGLSGFQFDGHYYS